MINPLPMIAFPQLITHKSGHHASDPLFADDSVAGIVDRDVIFEVDAVEGWRDGGLLGQEGLGLWGGHFGW